MTRLIQGVKDPSSDALSFWMHSIQRGRQTYVKSQRSICALTHIDALESQFPALCIPPARCERPIAVDARTVGTSGYPLGDLFRSALFFSLCGIAHKHPRKAEAITVPRCAAAGGSPCDAVIP